MQGDIVQITTGGYIYPYVIYNVLDGTTSQANNYTLVYNGHDWKVQGYDAPHTVEIIPSKISMGSTFDVIVYGNVYPLTVEGFNKEGVVANGETVMYQGNGVWQIKDYPHPHEVLITGSFPTGIKDVDKQIMFSMDLKTLNEICKTNKYLNEICNDNEFWREKVLTEVDPLVTKYVTDYKEYYKELHDILNRRGDRSVHVSTSFKNVDYWDDNRVYIPPRLELIIGLVSHGVKDIDVNDDVFSLMDKDFIQWFVEHDLLIYDENNKRWGWGQGELQVRRIIDIPALEWLYETKGILPKDLHVSLDKKRFDTAQWLYDHGVKARNPYDNLMEENNLEAIKWLNEHGKSPREYNAFQAIVGKRWEILDYILDQGVVPTSEAIGYLVAYKDTDRLKRIAAMGKFPEARYVDELDDGREYLESIGVPVV